MSDLQETLSEAALDQEELEAAEKKTQKHTLKNLQAAIQVWDKVYKLNHSPEAKKKCKQALEKYEAYCSKMGIIPDFLNYLTTSQPDNWVLPS